MWLHNNVHYAITLKIISHYIAKPQNVCLHKLFKFNYKFARKFCENILENTPSVPPHAAQGPFKVMLERVDTCPPEMVHLPFQFYARGVRDRRNPDFFFYSGNITTHFTLDDNVSVSMVQVTSKNELDILVFPGKCYLDSNPNYWVACRLGCRIAKDKARYCAIIMIIKVTITILRK